MMKLCLGQRFFRDSMMNSEVDEFTVQKEKIKRRLTESNDYSTVPVSKTSEFDIRVAKLEELSKRRTVDEFERQLSLFDKTGVPSAKTTKLLAPMNYYLARSTLFLPLKVSGNNSRPRVYLDDHTLYEDSEVKIQYSGYILDMVDHGVYLEALRRAASVIPYDDGTGNGKIPEHSKIIINRADFLKSLGHSQGGQGYILLEKSFTRLFKAALIIKIGKLTHYYHLLSALTYDKQQGLYYYAIPRSSFVLFFNNQFGYINMLQRKTLANLKDETGKKRPHIALSLWMQQHISPHRRGQPHWISLEKLQKHAEQKGRLRDFRNAMKAVLENLLNTGIITYGHIDDHNVVYWK